MWKLVSVDRTWILFKEREIVLVSKLGNLFDSSGKFLAHGKMREYAAQVLGTPENLERPVVMPIELVTEVHRLLNKIQASVNGQAPTDVRSSDMPAKRQKPVVVFKEEDKKKCEADYEEEKKYLRDILMDVCESQGYQMVYLKNQVLVTGHDRWDNPCIAAVRGSEIYPYQHEVEGVDFATQKERNTKFTQELLNLVRTTASKLEDYGLTP